MQRKRKQNKDELSRNHQSSTVSDSGEDASSIANSRCKGSSGEKMGKLAKTVILRIRSWNLSVKCTKTGSF